MPQTVSSLRPRVAASAIRLLGLAASACLALIAAPPAHAERADSRQRITVEADQPGSLDLLKQVVIFNGNVVITQGTLVLKADRVEVRQSPDGFRAATALGSAGRRASFRQKRDALEEWVEGEAERIEYDGRSGIVVLIGQAEARRLRGAAVADQLNGNRITWDANTERLSVEGGPQSVTPANPGGRVRLVLTPEDAASAPASAPQPLKPATGLGERK
ncbi:lipopolysaccharide transport periplasmic protein LptA [Aquabacterium sp. J223]|uniref:lipopolysaccharide transport periplasmic protein LptA n=1 Tax=Aquabacterium sp. J223 TaxID=2898431 RepID=UPI0021ADA636|nr:lipopolysaccharide transport periplasmic protein LptA [Aquabacterium sp. J223]UUX95864.1 lipopolysaccharide transport periplasmic protein LptA [Aquabacterium sp. J223]